jgi:hypothetical protein
MENHENGLEYLQLLISFYMDHEDKKMESLLMSILKGIERMKVCEL